MEARGRLELAEEQLNRLQAELLERALTAAAAPDRLVGPANRRSRPSAELQALLDLRDQARAEHVTMGRQFVAVTKGAGFAQHCEFLAHALGPLQQATQKLAAAAAPCAATVVTEVGPGEVAAEARRAVEEFEGWVHSKTAATVEARTETALAALLSAAGQLLGPVRDGEPAGRASELLERALPHAVDEANAALVAESEFWDDQDPLATLPLPALAAAAARVVAGLQRQMGDVESIGAAAAWLEGERLPAAAVWVGVPPPSLDALAELEELELDGRQALDAALLQITTLRSRPAQDRDLTAVATLEGRLPGLRKAAYDSAQAVARSREQLFTLAQEHFPELPLNYPAAGLLTANGASGTAAADPPGAEPTPDAAGGAAAPVPSPVGLAGTMSFDELAEGLQLQRVPTELVGLESPTRFDCTEMIPAGFVAGGRKCRANGRQARAREPQGRHPDRRTGACRPRRGRRHRGDAAAAANGAGGAAAEGAGVSAEVQPGR